VKRENAGVTGYYLPLWRGINIAVHPVTDFFLRKVSTYAQKPVAISE
jgi:hypothetical protein